MFSRLDQPAPHLQQRLAILQQSLAETMVKMRTAEGWRAESLACAAAEYRMEIAEVRDAIAAENYPSRGEVRSRHVY